MIKDSQDIPSTSGVSDEIQKEIIKDINAVSKKGFLYDRKVGISISNNEDLGALGYSDIHLRDLSIEIVRQLLISGAIIVYGGDLRKEGFTEIFSDLALQYRSMDEPRKFNFVNYFAFPIGSRLTKQNRLDFEKNRSTIVTVPPPEELKIIDDVYIIPDTVEKKYIWAKSLTKMRVQMIDESDARIFVGGKVGDYLGIMPGIIEETFLTIKSQKPVYVSGTMGGAALQVIKGLTGKDFDFISDEYHSNKEYKKFTEYYNGREQEKIDYDEVLKYFSRVGLEGISKINGLSTEENERLFFTPHLSEIIFLIFKGLSNISRGHH
jgi:hypothetical protein